MQRSKPARDRALLAAVTDARDARPLEPTRRRPRTRDELRELVDGCLPGRRYEVRSAYRRRGGVEEWLGGVR